jgi:hypothetical protein
VFHGNTQLVAKRTIDIAFDASGISKGGSLRGVTSYEVVIDAYKGCKLLIASMLISDDEYSYTYKRKEGSLLTVLW